MVFILTNSAEPDKKHFVLVFTVCKSTRLGLPVYNRAGRYYLNTGISRYFISVIRIVIQFGPYRDIFMSIVTICCWNMS